MYNHLVLVEIQCQSRLFRFNFCSLAPQNARINKLRPDSDSAWPNWPRNKFYRNRRRKIERSYFWPWFTPLGGVSAKIWLISSYPRFWWYFRWCYPFGQFRLFWWCHNAFVMLNDLSGSVFGASPPPKFFFSKNFFFIFFCVQKYTRNLGAQKISNSACVRRKIQCLLDADRSDFRPDPNGVFLVFLDA